MLFILEVFIFDPRPIYQSAASLSQIKVLAVVLFAAR